MIHIQLSKWKWRSSESFFAGQKMSKRAIAPRSLEDIEEETDRLRADIKKLEESIAGEKDRLCDRIRVLEKEAFAHSDAVKRRVELRNETMRKQLPPYFYKVLVEQPHDPTLGALTGLTFSFDENGEELRHRIMSSTCEVELWFEHGQSFNWRTIDEIGYEEGLDVNTISSKKWAVHTDEDVWRRLLKANDDRVPSAVVGLYCYAQDIVSDPDNDTCIVDAWEWMDANREWGLDELKKEHKDKAITVK
jgi:hypothetical protein